MRIKNIYLAGLLLASTSLALGSCSQDSDPADAPQHDQSISFAPYIAQTRADVANVETLKQDGFHVWISHNNGDTFDRDVDDVSYLYDESVRYSMPLEGWDYTNKRFWPSDDAKLSFFALANGGQSLSTTHSKTDTGAPVYTFDCPARFASQTDLLAAQDLNKAKSTDAVRFNFQHMLSKIQFAATAHVPSNYKITLKKVEVFYTSGKIHNKAHIDLNDMDVDLVSDAYYTGGEAVSAGVLYSSGSGLMLSHSESVSLVNQESDNYLMLLPQVYEEGDIYLTVSYDIDGSDDAHYGDGEGANLKDSYTDVKILLPTAIGEGGSNTGWQKGKQYTYVLDITADEVTFGGVQVADWGTQTDTNVPDIPVVPNIYYQDGVFHINTAEGLKIFSDIVNGNNQEKVPGYTANDGVPKDNHANGQLDSDIDLSTVCGASEELGSWKPIGYPDSYYGTFDGQNHYVDNLYIHEPNWNYQALFGIVDTNAVIKNVKVRGVDVEAYYYVAALVANMRNSATVTNCHVEADANHPVTLKSRAHHLGTMVGLMSNSTVTDCSVHANGGTISVSAVQYEQAAGFVGYTKYSTLKNCSVHASNGGQLAITAKTSFTGGFAGFAYICTLINCSVYSDDLALSPINITAEGSYAGGFAGYVYQATIVGCSSAVSKVVSNNDAGYGIGYTKSGTIHSSWAYCASAPTYDGYANGSPTLNTALYGTSPISYTDNKAALDNSINNYNAGAPADKQAVPFNAQGTYGPIVTTELPD